MASKARIVEQLGERALLLPSAINDALAANDRLKFYLTLLQGARSHALQPRQPSPDLRVERENSGVADSALDDVPGASAVTGAGLLSVPGAGRIGHAILDDLDLMLRPIEAAPGKGVAALALRARLAVLAEPIGRWGDDVLQLSEVETLTRVGAGSDTVHQLVMDLHRELIALQVVIASEAIDGAVVYGLDECDRPLVGAFMSGVNQTAALKLDHPGLGTTATRTGGRLVIQNDIGTTDAHVLVVSVSGLSATVTYADVHRSREQFFRDLMEPWNVAWSGGPAAPDADTHLIVGRHEATDGATLERYLTHLGSRLVFLIDWNKAKKALARFMTRDAAVGVLRWAAEAGVGHRAFLEAGEPALRSVLERCSHPQLKFGMQLDEAIGSETASAFFRSVLRIASEGVVAGRSRQLIADEIEAELLFHLGTPSRETLTVAGEHAALMVAMADRIRRVLLRTAGPRAGDEATRAATLVGAWERRADELARRHRQSRPGAMPDGLVAEADGAADALEQAAFLLGLASSRGVPAVAASLVTLGEMACAGTREYVRCIEHARDLPNAPRRDGIDNVLVAVNRLLQIVEETRDAERAVEARLVQECADFRELHVLSRAARALSAAVDGLRGCGLVVRDLVFSDSVVPR
ncbi:MAG: hypothetical protein AB7H96_18465 [Vicinamibacterales bacterium]